MLTFGLVYCCLPVAVPLDGPTPAEMSAFEAAAEKAGRDPAAHVRLASWCEIHGMQIERHKHLSIALELAPDHPAIHGLNGQVKAGDQILARSGSARVEAVGVGASQTVWNLKLAESHSYLVGRLGVVVHDGSPIAEFDVAPESGARKARGPDQPFARGCQYRGLACSVAAKSVGHRDRRNSLRS